MKETITNSVVIAIDDFVKIKKPYEIFTYSDRVFYSCIYQGIVTYRDNKIVPALCDQYKISKNGKKYKFVFETKRWSNGEKITAYDFLSMFRYLIMHFEKYTCAKELCVIKRTLEYLEGKCSIEKIGVKAINDKILEINLEYENNEFLAILTSCSYSPYRSKSDDTRSSNISNGPYYIKKIDKKNKEIIVRRNPYFDIKSNVDEIVFKTVKSRNIQEKKFLKNEIDITCNTLYPKRIDRKTIISKSPLKYFLYINNSVDFSQLERRQFYEKIKRINWASLSVALNNSHSFMIDPIRKKQTHWQISNNNSISNHKSLKLLYSNYYPNLEVSKVISKIFNEFGYSVLLKSIDYKSFPKYIENNNYDLILSIVLPPNSSFSSTFGTFIDNEFLGNRNKEYLSLICKYYKSYKNVKLKKSILFSLENLLQESLPVIPICCLNFVYKIQTKIIGFNYKIDGTPSYETINIRKVAK